MARIWIMWCWLLLGLAGQAQAAWQLQSSSSDYLPATELHYLVDETRELTPSTVITNLETLQWQRGRERVLSLGYVEGAVWMWLEIHNTVSLGDWIFSVDTPLLRSLDVFVLNGGNIDVVHQTGDRFEFAARPLLHRNFLFPVTIPPGEKRSLLIRAEAPYALLFPMRLTTLEEYQQQDGVSLWIGGLLCGFMLAMAVYNLFVFTATQDTSYFNCAALSLSLVFFMFSVQGVGFQYIWPENIYLQQKSNLLSSAASLMFGALFVISFLRLRENSMFLYRYFSLLALISLATAVVGLFTDEFLLVQAMAYLIVISCVIMLVVGITFWGQGQHEARFFVLGWGVFLGAVTVYAFSVLGYSPYRPGARVVMEASFTLQLALLAFAMADRINRERQVRSMLEKQNEQYQRQHELSRARAQETELSVRHELDRRSRQLVEERDEALARLTQLQQSLEHITVLDDLTGLHNQNYFFDVLRREWDRAMRDQRYLALLVVELDDFYEIRERHGQLVQDECIKVVAALLSETFSRPADVIVRYGDKVFGVLLPETEVHGARQLARGICSRIAEAPHDFGVSRLRLTISVGIASGIPQTGRRFKELLETAESALYVAHSNGGNQVQNAALPGPDASIEA